MSAYHQSIFSLDHRVTKLERIITNIMLGRKPCGPTPISGTGSGGFTLVPTFSALPIPGNPNNIYLTDDTDIMWYWDGTQYQPLFDPTSFIQNQVTTPQTPGNFWIHGTGKITSNGAPTMEWTQTAGAGYGVYIPFHTSTIPVGYFSLGDSGLAHAMLNVSIPSSTTPGTNDASLAISKGVIELDGVVDQPFARLSLLRINDLWLFKNYNNNLLNSNGAGTNAIGIWDETFSLFRVLIRPNGNWLVGGSTSDNGARFQISGGPLSLENNTVDYPGGNGFMFYRSDLHRFRVFVNGVWKNMATTDDIAAGGGGVTSFNGRVGVVIPQAGDYTKSDVGLSNVDNTSDANKPVSIAQAAADALKINLTEKAAANGVATLDATTKIPVAQLPTITKAMVGLGNVDDTSDLNKPISNAQAAVNAQKADLNSPAFIGVPTAPTAAAGTNTTQLATTAFVMAQITASVGVVPITSSPYTIQASDDGQILDWRGSGTLTLNVATGLRVGWHCEVVQSAVGAITFASAGGAAVFNRTGSLITAGQYAMASLRQVNISSFRVQGDLI